MTPERIKELRELCDKATPGPWVYCGRRVYGTNPHLLDLAACDIGDGNAPYSVDEQNAEFIAASRTALPEALAEIERLRADNASRSNR